MEINGPDDPPVCVGTEGRRPQDDWLHIWLVWLRMLVPITEMRMDEEQAGGCSG